MCSCVCHYIALHRPETVDSKRPGTGIRPRESRKGEGTSGSACGPLQADMQTRCDHLLQQQETRASNTCGLRSTGYESRRVAQKPGARTVSKDSAFRLANAWSRHSHFIASPSSRTVSRWRGRLLDDRTAAWTSRESRLSLSTTCLASSRRTSIASDVPHAQAKKASE